MSLLLTPKGKKTPISYGRVRTEFFTNVNNNNVIEVNNQSFKFSRLIGLLSSPVYENLTKNAGGLSSVSIFSIDGCKIEFDQKVKVAVINDINSDIRAHVPNAVLWMSNCTINQNISISAITSSMAEIKPGKPKENKTNWDNGLDLLRKLW